MASFEYTITTDAFSLGGQSFSKETLDFTLPYGTNGTFPLSLTFQGESLSAAIVHPVNVNEVFLTLQGPSASLQTPFLPLPTVSGQTTMGFNDSFGVALPAGHGFITGEITATGISLPEPASVFLLLLALAYICLRIPSGLSALARRALGNTYIPWGMR